MIHDEQERLAERYANNRMSPAEREDLLLRAKDDSYLRHLIEAEEGIVRAIQRERTVLMTVEAEPGVMLLSKLTESNGAAAGSAAASGGGSAIGGITTAASGGSYFIGMVLATISAVGLGVGLYLADPFRENSPATRSPIERIVHPRQFIMQRPGATGTPSSSRVKENATTASGEKNDHRGERLQKSVTESEGTRKLDGAKGSRTSSGAIRSASSPADSRTETPPDHGKGAQQSELPQLEDNQVRVDVEGERKR